MPNAKRRVQVRRAEPGAHDPIERARQAGIKEGREQAKEDYKKAEAAAVARAKADERAVRNEVMERMEKEIEDLEERCRVLERQKAGPDRSKPRRKEKASPWDKQHDNQEWIAPFNEDDTQLEPNVDPRRRGTLGR